MVAKSNERDVLFCAESYSHLRVTLSAVTERGDRTLVLQDTESGKSLRARLDQDGCAWSVNDMGNEQRVKELLCGLGGIIEEWSDAPSAQLTTRGALGNAADPDTGTDSDAGTSVASAQTASSSDIFSRPAHAAADDSSADDDSDDADDDDDDADDDGDDDDDDDDDDESGSDSDNSSDSDSDSDGGRGRGKSKGKGQGKGRNLMDKGKGKGKGRKLGKGKGVGGSTLLRSTISVVGLGALVGACVYLYRNPDKRDALVAAAQRLRVH